MNRQSFKPLPMTPGEMRQRGWTELDVLLISGDAYVDHPAFGTAVIGRILEAQGLRVGILAQPAWQDPAAFATLGRPRLFCGISAGNLDSLLANYTAARRKRLDDAYSPGGQTGNRPNYATVVYSQLARRAFPGLPLILGGIEASLRRVAHYDYWQDKLRPGILADAKADLLVYGMAERAIVEVASRLQTGSTDLGGIRGTARLLGANAAATHPTAHTVRLPSLEDCRQNPAQLLDLTRLVEQEQNPFCGRQLLQAHANRLLVVEPPPLPMPAADLDAIYALPFTRQPHPAYKQPIPAYEMIKDSITVMRGCAGGCSFCGLGLHQGKFLCSRSLESVLHEVGTLASQPQFHGTVSDLGGPSANLYGCGNGHSAACQSCRRPSCLFPAICPQFVIADAPGAELLARVSRLPGVKHTFVASGIRMDVVLHQDAYLRRLIRNHVSGHLKVAPEHLDEEVLTRMRKPAGAIFARFRQRFETESRAAGKQQYLVPYFISNFPGCTDQQMQVVQQALARENWRPRQVQDYIPLPMTPAAAMYVTGLDYATAKPIEVRRGLAERRSQQRALGHSLPRPTGRGRH